MPEGNAATQGAAGAGGPGPVGQPGQPPAQPEGAAAPPPEGAATPAPPPQGGGPPEQEAEGAAPVQPQADPWAEAAKWQRAAQSAEKRAGDRQAEIARLRGAEKALKDRLGDNYLEEVERLTREAAARAQQRAMPPPAAEPAPQVAQPAYGTGQRGLPPAVLMNWAGDAFMKLYQGYEETEAVVDPNTGEQVQRSKRIAPDLQTARALAEDMDALFRSKGVRPPWDGLFQLGQQAPQAVQPKPVASPDQPPVVTLEDLERREGMREAWEDNFYAELATVSTKELGEDFFEQQVTVEIGGEPRTMTRERALYHLCKPSRQNPGGVPLRAGLLEHMPGDLRQRWQDIAFNAGMQRAGSVGGGIPGGAEPGPPPTPEARKQRAKELLDAGIAGGHWAPEPPPDAAPVHRVVSVSGRSSGLPR